MMLKGKLWKDGKFWLIECPTLDATTQGRTKSEACAMMIDWIETSINRKGVRMSLTMCDANQFELRFADPKPIIALMIERARVKSGMTLEAVAKKMGLKSRSNARHYETGKHSVSIDKLQDLVDAFGMEFEISLNAKA